MQGKQVYKHTYFVLCFVEDVSAIFDSVNALEAGQTDLSETLMYKLLTICGNFLQHNKDKPKTIAWIEQTRSSVVQPGEKQ